MSSSESQSPLRVTNNILACGNEVYQISNIVRVGKFKKEKRNGIIIFLILLFIAGTIFLSQEFPGYPEVVPVGIVVVLLLFGFAIFRRSTYVLRIETNSGTGELLWSKKEDQINSLIDLITSVMERPDREVNYIVNLHDNSVHETVMGDKFSSIKDSVIGTRGARVKGGGDG